MKRFVIIFCFLVFTSNVLAQEYVKHQVQEGETVESIAKKYKVTPFNLIKLNPDLRKGISPNMVIIISKSGQEKQNTTNQEVVVKERVPFGFINHKVRRKETLFALTQKYEVTEDEIKKYNTELYASTLKKGMRLQIPKYRDPIVVENVKDTVNFQSYIVQPKETRWSIAHKYGISVDSLHALNPDMQQIIGIGEELWLPKTVTQDSVSVEIKAFKEYVVPAKQTMFSLTKELQITQLELEALNPKLKELGLQNGMVLLIPNKEVQQQLVNAENYVFYQVKPREGFFRLKIKLNATKEELEAWNPILIERGLQPGMILKLPKDRALSFDVKNSVIVEKFNLLDSLDYSNRSQIAFVLPFRLNSLDVNSPSSVKQRIEKDTRVKYATDFYSGALIALDSVKQLGLFVEVKTFDSEASRATVRNLARQHNFSNTKAVIGPIYPSAFNEMASAMQPYNVPVFSPLTNSKIELKENVFLTVPKEESLRDLMIGFIQRKKENHNLIIVADSTSLEAKQRLMNVFPEAKVLNPTDNLFITTDDVQPLLSDQVENWVIVETDNSTLLANVTSVLNSANIDDFRIKLFTTNKTKAFDNENVSNSYLSNLNFHFPQTDGLPDSMSSFVKKYKAKFNTEPNRYATRGFDITLDVLLRLAYNPNMYEVARKVGETSYVENKFSYTKEFFSGYYNTSGHILMYEDMEIKEVKITSDNME